MGLSQLNFLLNYQRNFKKKWANIPPEIADIEENIKDIKEFIILNSSNAAGRYIGILERAIILTLVLKGLLSAVAFVLTAKSIARFNELKEKDFAEYYLIGTLASMLIAIIAGLVLLKIMTLI